MLSVKRVWTIIVLVGCLCLSAISIPATAAPMTSASRIFWVQTIDSCKLALPGASFVLRGNGLNVPRGPAPGSKPLTVNSTARCPEQRGNCSPSFPTLTGCLSWTIPLPRTGRVYYTITQTKAPKTPSPGYVYCTGGSVCPDGPVVVKITATPSGLTATVFNVFPDKKSITWPTDGGRPYTGSATDPAVVHDSRLGTGSCDGDRDADDHLDQNAGAIPAHCDSDKDRH